MSDLIETQGTINTDTSQWQELVLMQWQQGWQNIAWQDIGVYFWGDGAYIYNKSVQADKNKEMRWLRFLCHILIERIPDDGLYEASDVLGGMYEFYRTRPEITAIPNVITKVPAKQGVIYERPTFVFDEE